MSQTDGSQEIESHLHKAHPSYVSPKSRLPEYNESCSGQRKQRHHMLNQNRHVERETSQRQVEPIGERRIVWSSAAPIGWMIGRPPPSQRGGRGVDLAEIIAGNGRPGRKLRQQHAVVRLRVGLSLSPCSDQRELTRKCGDHQRRDHDAPDSETKPSHNPFSCDPPET